MFVEQVKLSETQINHCIMIMTIYSWTPLIRSPTGKRKWFILMGFQINEVKISSKALQGE